MTVIQPRFEIKLNTSLEEADLVYSPIDEDKIFLSQFEGDEHVVYLTLNGRQLIVHVNQLKAAVDMLHSYKER